jgi:hypothetical protein
MGERTEMRKRDKCGIKHQDLSQHLPGDAKPNYKKFQWEYSTSRPVIEPDTFQMRTGSAYNMPLTFCLTESAASLGPTATINKRKHNEM